MRQQGRGLAHIPTKPMIFTSTNAICSPHEPSPPPLSVKFAMFAQLACTTSQRFVHKCSAPLTCFSLASSLLRRCGAKAVSHKYSRVHCVCNAHNLWANVVHDDSVAATSFKLNNPAA